jgi:NuA3 HAT complex component NTO1
MVSHTTRTATTATPPVRGRGRGRPRLYARGSSSGTGSRRKLPPPKPTEYSPVGRRRPQFHNAYRPGGAGGGGRYIHPDTGEEVSATVYKEAVKNEDKLDVAVSTIKRSAPPRLQPPPVGSDGVYKPREERSYIEFHPSFNIDQILPVYSAEEIDGENYTPPQPTETRTVKILDIKEEEELRNDFPDISPSKHLPEFGNSELTTGLNSTSSYFHRTTYDESPKHTLTEERCVSPVSPSNIATRTLTTDTSITDLSLSMAASSCGMPNNFAFMMNNSTFGSIVSPIPHIDGIAIDPALAALTPPPLPLKGSLGVPIDPALSAVDQPQPVQPQTQTPAATPTDGPAKDDGGSSSTPPPPLILKTPAAQTGISPPKRGLNDVPTLASLRAHRTTAGKPPPRSIPPATTRKPRMQNQNTHEQLNLRAPSYRKIQPFRFPWSGEVGSGGPCGLNNPQSSNNALTISDTMIAVGYQQSSQFECSETLFRDHPDSGVDEELGISEVDLVEYDMDEQDDKWLTTCNSHRMLNNNNTISREIFEFALTKIEKEWISLERKMPKVQAKPHGAGVSSRRRNSGRGGEDEDDEGAEDSKCVICDDGECENANAIVFCDGCNLAVHQECYGVPYIPEGQWHCRKCQQIPRKTAVCFFLV